MNLTLVSILCYIDASMFIGHTDSVIELGSTKGSIVTDGESGTPAGSVIDQKTSEKRSLREADLEGDDLESPPSSPGASCFLLHLLGLRRY